MTRLAFISSVLTLAALMFVLGSSMCSIASAESAISCHCFQDRQLSEHQPNKIDPYLLATVQNRFMAMVFSVPRKDIVQAKMAGVTNNRLWIAYYLADKAALSVDNTLSIRKNNHDWQTTLQAMSIDPEQLSPPFLAGVLQNAPEGFLAWAVVKASLAKYFPFNNGAQDPILANEQVIQEMILATVLASKTRQSVNTVLSEQQKTGSWGGLLVEQKQSIEQIDEWMRFRIQ